MLGPTASGGLYGKAELLEAMDPMFGGGEMIHEVFHDHSHVQGRPVQVRGGHDADRAAGRAWARRSTTSRRSAWTPSARTRRRSPRYALDRLLDAGATVFGPKDASIRGGAVSFWYRDVHPHDLATILNEEGVAIRAGHHCAQLVMRRFDTPATARASFYVYNTKEEVDVLVESLAKAEAIFI